MGLHVAEVAPAAPAAGYLVASLALFLAFCVCWGLTHVWSHTIGWLFTALADLLDKVHILRVHPFGPVSAFLRSIDKNVRHALATAALKSEEGAAWLFHQGWHQMLWMARELANLAGATAHALATAAVWNEKQLARMIYAATVGRFKAIGAQLVRLIRHDIPWLFKRAKWLAAHVAHATAIAAGAAVAFPRRIGQLERKVTSQGRRLTKLEKVAGSAAVTAAVGAALAALGASWVRCNNWKRIGRQGCQMDSDLLSSLLLDVAVLTVAFNIEEFAKELQAVVGEAAGAIHDWAT